VKAALLALVLAAGCASRAPDGVLLWHAYAGPERAALEAVAAAWNGAHPDAPLTLVAVPYDAFADKITSAVPGGNGPDLFVYSHDRIGDWAAAGIIEPLEFWVDDALADRYATDAIAAMAYRGSLWGLPLATKSLALYYRTDRVTAPPATTDDLFAAAVTARGSGGYALAYKNPDLYTHAPWLHGFGGAVMTGDGEPRIASAEAAAALAFARRLVERGVAPAEASGPLVATLFNEGKAAMAVSGPWFQGDIAPGVPWRVTTLPVVSETGRPAAPFLGAEGVLMSARARDKDAAFAVLAYLAGDASAALRARQARQVVPNRAAYDEADIGGDPVLRAFRDQLEHTVPMPAAPEMRMVWTPYRTALGTVLAGTAAPAAALDDVAREVAGYAAAVKR
jgi:arabinogalactan oligomer/maltooligosaccharide transport system substrate-binding protein